MAVSDDLALARLLGILYTEVMQRKPADPNKPINRSTHTLYEQPMIDEVKAVEYTNTNLWAWGPGGFSPQTNVQDLHAQWGGGTAATLEDANALWG